MTERSLFCRTCKKQSRESEIGIGYTCPKCGGNDVLRKEILEQYRKDSEKSSRDTEEQS